MTGLTNDGRKAYIRETNAVGVPRDELRRHYNEIFDRLRRYEDVERRGMLVELPIKPGQMCYAISTPCGGCEHDDELPTDENLEICRRCEKRQVIEVPRGSLRRICSKSLPDKQEGRHEKDCTYHSAAFGRGVLFVCRSKVGRTDKL